MDDCVFSELHLELSEIHLAISELIWTIWNPLAISEIDLNYLKFI